MHSVFRWVGYAVSAGLSFAGTSDAAVRVAWRRQPRPMPHQLAGMLDSNLRLSYRNPGETLGLYGFEAGMTVLDAGCGTGLFTTEMARMVGPAGIVHAVDVQSPCLVNAARRVSAAGLSDRVRFHHCGLYELPFPDESVDLSVLIATLGEVPNPLLGLVELRRVTRIGGRVAVSEELLDPAYLPARSARALMEEAGFRFGGKSGSPLYYNMIFFRDA